MSLYDKNDNIIKCDLCNNPAGEAIIRTSSIGINYELHRCTQHPFNPDVKPIEFIYRPPEIKLNDSKPILDPNKFWIINLRDKN